MALAPVWDIEAQADFHGDDHRQAISPRPPKVRSQELNGTMWTGI
jgi:hypothetical protein